MISRSFTTSAMCWRIVNKPAEAQPLLEKALKIDPNSSKVKFPVGHGSPRPGETGRGPR